MPRTFVIGAVLVLTVALFAYGRLTVRAGTRALEGPYLGSYAAVLTRAEAAARGDSRLAGRFTLVLRRNGTYSDSNLLDGRAAGHLAALADHRLRFYDDSGCGYGGLERPEGGVYQWSVNGEKLTLRLVSEGPCSGRTDTLTFPVWFRR
jgi:hypothetical protein